MNRSSFLSGICRCVLAFAGLAGSAFAAPSLSLTQSSFLGLQPGESFTVQINLNNPDAITIVAYDFFVHASDAGVFSITEQQLFGAVDQPNSLAGLPYAVTTGSDTNDFGAYNASGMDGFGTGSFQAQTLTFQVSPSADMGSYSLSIGWNQPSLIGGPSLVDSDVNEYQMGEPIELSVAVVPEPQTTGLFVLAGLILCMVFRRRCRA